MRLAGGFMLLSLLAISLGLWAVVVGLVLKVGGWTHLALPIGSAGGCAVVVGLLGVFVAHDLTAD